MSRSPLEVFSLGEKDHKEFLALVSPSTRPHIQVPIQDWIPPPVFVIKVNCDTTLCQNSSHGGIVVIVRNHRRETTLAKSIPAPFKSLICEDVLTVRAGMLETVLEGTLDVIVESDNLELIQAIKKGGEGCRLGIHNIVADIIHLVYGFSSCCFQHLPRDQNSIADSLAKRALSLSSAMKCSSCMMSFAHSDPPPKVPNGMEGDRIALLAFKARIIHDPFHVLSSWNDSISYCEWSGVLCGGRRHPNRVRALYLRSSGLVGSMAQEIGNLSFLQEIQLENNSFNGEIPHEVSFLVRLHYLVLSNNSFEGEISPNISRCSNLIELRLSYNNIVGKIPMELGSLSKLEILQIHENKLTGQIPPSFGNLSSLITFSSRMNGFSGSIPDTFGQLTRLLNLGLYGNYLYGTIPPALYNLSSLSVFDVGQNQLSGSLPQNLGSSLPNLSWLSIEINQFHGSVPISISNLSKLEILYAGANNLTGKMTIDFGGLSKLTQLSLPLNNLGSGEAGDLSFIKTLTNCSSLNTLELGHNQLAGVIPSSIANLSSQLSWLALEQNQICGNIPIGMGNLVGLQEFSLNKNLLEGSITSSIGRLQMVIQLRLDGNRFTGPIPPSLGNLTLLTDLNLEDNRLDGKIPSSIGKCKYLLRLRFNGNSLHGIISKEIFDLSMLTELYLNRNYFNGSLPLEVGQLKSLEILDVSENMLSGEVPSNLGTCTSLEHLFMKRNLFQGSIPSSLGSLRGLEELDLSHNNFSGLIPKDLGTLKLLHYINLSSNLLEGEVPVEGVFGNVSQVSITGNNKLCGGIPELHLPACKTQKSKEDGTAHVFKLIVTICSCGAALFFILMTYFFIIYQRRKGKRESTTFLIADHYFKISYAQLFRATDGFSSRNLVGVGSFGFVYKGVLNHGETIVAVKVFNNGQKGYSKSFIAECEALRNIRHRNLVRILTSCSSIDFEGNDFKALVYEFMPGGNLETWLHRCTSGIEDEQRHFNFVQRLNIAIDIATALDYLHHYCHMQILHCDIKPSNILFDDDLTAHLSDFGISKILEKATGRSQDEISSIGIKGSIGYIAPGVDISVYGDVYSYGILLLELFTRKRPTDEMFKDDFNLHCWAETALLGGLSMAIMDPSLLQMEDEAEAVTTATTTTKTQRSMKDRVRECLNSVIRIGVTCSAESPWERMDMNDVVKELHLIRDTYLKLGIQRER